MFERRFKSENYTGTGGRCGEKRFERENETRSVRWVRVVFFTNNINRGEQRRGDEEAYGAANSVANVMESCKKKLKQGMKVQFSLGREPTTRKYVVVDIAPIEGGGVEEKKTKKKEGDDKIDDQDEKIEEEEEDEYFEEIPTSYGRVDKLSQSFGFIQKAHGRMPSHNNGNRREEQGLFFHYTALKDKTDVGKLTVGTAVSFEIVKVSTGSAKGKKANAINVQLCDEETVRAIESELRLQRKLAEKEKNAALLDKDGIDGDSWGKKKVNVVDESNNSKNGKKYVSAPASGEEENVSSSEQQNDSSVSLELGKIAVIKNGFGFIKCEERVEDVFFHFTQLKNFENPKVGKIVQFTVHRDQKRDAMVAHDVCEAPEGSKVVFETVDERSVRGVCKETPGICLRSKFRKILIFVQCEQQWNDCRRKRGRNFAKLQI